MPQIKGKSKNKRENAHSKYYLRKAVQLNRMEYLSLGDLVNGCLKSFRGAGGEWVFKLPKSLCSNSTFTKTQFSRHVASYVSLPPKKENKPFWTALRLYISH